MKGTDLLGAATTYIDEFSKPANVISSTLKKLQDTYSQQYNRRFGILMIITGAVLLVLLGVIYAYSYSVVSPIKKLSEIADRISMGDLDARIDVKATGEIGVLAQSLERMQTSVKAAIERLQKRR